MGLFDFLRGKTLEEQNALFDVMKVMCEDGVDADEMPNGIGEYGLVVTNPIPCETIFGSRGYLDRLRAADGSKIDYERIGSAHSSVSPHPIDVYRVVHQSGQHLGDLYISPYQKRVSRKAPLGFLLAESPFGRVHPLKEVVTESDGTRKHYSCGVLHREDGPALIEVYPDYSGPEKHRSWYRFGVLDRLDGPAVIGGRTINGQYEWWRGGIRHREDGPAVIEIIESYNFGHGPVYEWWRDGVRQKVQDGDGIIYYYKNDEIVLTELADGSRIIERDGECRYEDMDGKDQGDPPPLEAYNGYLEWNASLIELYDEPESTFEIFNSEFYDDDTE